MGKARRLIVGLSLSALVFACDRTRSGSNESEFTTQYRGFLIDTRSHSASAAEAGPSDDWTIITVPNTRFEIFDILTAEGRRADNLWLRDGKVFDWNQYKQIAQTNRGSLVLHERFQPDYPDGNPWPSFLISAIDGESGHRVDSLRADSTLESIDFVYVYEDGSLLAASYDAQGKLVIIQARQDLGGGAYHPGGSMDNPFAAYGLPESISPQIDEPHVNDELREGLAKTTSYAYKNAPLETAFVVRQYELGRLFQIIRQSAKDGRTSSQLIRFANRPYDKQIREAAAAYQTGRPRSVHRPIALDQADRSELSIPDVPLVVGGTAETGGDRLNHVTVHGSPRFVRAGDPLLSLAHFRIEFDRNSDAQLVSGNSGNTRDRYVWTGNYSYTVDDVPMTVTVTIDGRAKTLTVAGSSFDLRHGNFVRIMISPDLEVTAEQIAIVKLSDSYDSERIVEIFESYIHNR